MWNTSNMVLSENASYRRVGIEKMKLSALTLSWKIVFLLLCFFIPLM